MQLRHWHRKGAGAFALFAALVLAGCAQITDRSVRLFSSKMDAVLIVNGQLLHGNVELIPDRTGTVNFSGGKGSIHSCFGSIRYSATTTGRIDLHCDDGTATIMPFNLLSDTRGYAYSNNPAFPASLVFGLSNQDARAYLTAPAGKRLVETPDGGFELQ